MKINNEIIFNYNYNYIKAIINKIFLNIINNGIRKICEVKSRNITILR